MGKVNNRSCSGPAIWQCLFACKHAFGFAACLATFFVRKGLLRNPQNIRFCPASQVNRSCSGPAMRQKLPHASMRKLLPHGRAFGQKKEAFGWKASKNYIYQNKRGDNFYKIIIPRSCFKQITKLLNFYEFKKLFLLVCNAVCIGKRELYSTGFHCLCLF